MHLYKQKKTFPHLGIMVSLVIFGLAAGYFLYGLSNVSDSVEEQQRDTLENAIERAVVSCYAIEGSYPSDIAYLEEHYGIAVDYDKFIINFQSIGANIKPGVQVIMIGGGEG